MYFLPTVCYLQRLPLCQIELRNYEGHWVPFTDLDFIWYFGAMDKHGHLQLLPGLFKDTVMCEEELVLTSSFFGHFFSKCINDPICH